jgi:hypothetical protein
MIASAQAGLLCVVCCECTGPILALRRKASKPRHPLLNFWRTYAILLLKDSEFLLCCGFGIPLPRPKFCSFAK